MRLGYVVLLLALATGCASTPNSSLAPTQPPTQASASDREPTSLPHSSFTIVGGIRILNMGRNSGLVTLLRDAHTAQPIRAKCIQGTDHAAGFSLQIDFGDDRSSKTLDLNHTNVALAAQPSMQACLILIDKLMETTSYYPAYITFSEDHKIKVGF